MDQSVNFYHDWINNGTLCVFFLFLFSYWWFSCYILIFFPWSPWPLNLGLRFSNNHDQAVRGWKNDCLGIWARVGVFRWRIRGNGRGKFFCGIFYQWKGVLSLILSSHWSKFIKKNRKITHPSTCSLPFI